MQSKKDSFSDAINLGYFFLLIKIDKDLYSNNLKKKLFYQKIDRLIDAGLKNIEIAWSNDKNWFDFVLKLKSKYPNLNLGSASIVSKKSIDESIKIGLSYSMMKFWDKNLFNYANKKNYLLIPGIKDLRDLEEAINLNCKIIKIYPIERKDDFIDITKYRNIDFIAAGGLSINDVEHYKSLGYKSIVIGDKGFKNQKLNPNIFEWFNKNK